MFIGATTAIVGGITDIAIVDGDRGISAVDIGAGPSARRYLLILHDNQRPAMPLLAASFWFDSTPGGSLRGSKYGGGRCGFGWRAAIVVAKDRLTEPQVQFAAHSNAAALGPMFSDNDVANWLLLRSKWHSQWTIDLKTPFRIMTRLLKNFFAEDPAQ